MEDKKATPESPNVGATELLFRRLVQGGLVNKISF